VEWLLELWCEGTNSLYRRRPPERPSPISDARLISDGMALRTCGHLFRLALAGGLLPRLPREPEKSKRGNCPKKCSSGAHQTQGSWISMLLSTRPPQHSHVKNKYNSLQASRIALCLRIIGLEDEVRRIHYGNTNRKTNYDCGSIFPIAISFPSKSKSRNIVRFWMLASCCICF